MTLKTLSSGAIIAIAIAGLLLTVTTMGAVSTFQMLPSNGTVVTAVNVDIYTDSGCTQSLTSIGWGNVAPGSNNTQTIYIKNSGTVPELLSISTSAWSPANASSLLTLTWNLGTSKVLAASASTPAILALAVSSSPGSVTTFSFNITITGTQQ